jgi:hypothetical protein
MKKFLIVVPFLLLFLCLAHTTDAQCAMCKGAAEANLKQGGGDPAGLNAGILYMLAVPYMLVFGIGYWWWRNRRGQEMQAIDMTEQ